jgi:hypothetical protein
MNDNLQDNKTITINLDDRIDDMRDEIKAAVLNRFAAQINRTLQGDFVEDLMETARASAQAKIDSFIDEFFTKPIVLTRKYGTPDRNVTAKELIMEYWEKSLFEKVNSSGCPSDHGEPRIKWVAESLMKTEINSASADIRKQLTERIDASFRDTVTTGILAAIGLNLPGGKK